MEPKDKKTADVVVPSFIDSRLVTLREPYSIASEQYRVLCTRISQLARDHATYILAVTSSLKGEGKTFTSINLAISMAKDFDEKVLLIEGDFKNPGLHGYLKRAPGFGLSDFMAGKIGLDSCLIPLFDGMLNVLLAGKIIGNPVKLLSSHKLEQLFKSIKGDFKYIIIDTPPIIPMADMNIYSTMVDGILLVIRAGKTPRSIVKRALSVLSSEKIIGAVLNGIEGGYSRYYYGKKYTY